MQSDSADEEPLQIKGVDMNGRPPMSRRQTPLERASLRAVSNSYGRSIDVRLKSNQPKIKRNTQEKGIIIMNYL